MKYVLGIAILSLFVLGCGESSQEEVQPPNMDWVQRQARINAADSLVFGTSYLPVYSRIYHHKRGKTFGLTITASLRNVSTTDTVYLLSADLYGTSGNLERSYLENPVYLNPMETLEIVIEETEEDGGTGGNFLFEWGVPKGDDPPFFEAVMISTLGQQGISFTTRGNEVD
ncbi:MAG: DUF3124 domain-containing protein [Eudoraea sp.]|nr:DUF3124 domain-containing protein [Eudoraea sp.]